MHWLDVASVTVGGIAAVSLIYPMSLHTLDITPCERSAVNRMMDAVQYAPAAMIAASSAGEQV